MKPNRSLRSMGHLTVCLAAAAAWVAVAATCEAQAERLHLDISEHVLSNGLKILVLERHHQPAFSAYLFYRVGAVNETTGQTGLSHFIEHLMSKGTRALGTTNYDEEAPLLDEQDRLWALIEEERRKAEPDAERVACLQEAFAEVSAKARAYSVSNEIDKIYVRHGAHDANATTSYDYTNYFVSLPKNKFELWCAIESQIMREVVFRGFYEEQHVVAEERRMRYDNDPGGALYEQLIAAAYTVHPYGRLVIGAMSDIEHYARPQTYAYHRLYYAPNRAVIVLVGDVETDKAVVMIERYFGDIPRQPDPPALVTVEPPQKGERRVAVEFDAKPQVGIAYHGTAVSEADHPVLDVLSEVFSSGRTSRLYRRLVLDEQVAVNVWSGILDMKYPALYLIFATPRAPHTVEEVERIIDEEIVRLQNEPVSERELERAKNRLKANFIRGLDTNDELASRVGFYEMIGTWRRLNRIVDLYDAVTADDVQRVARRTLVRSRRTVALIVPEEEGGDEAASRSGDAPAGSEVH